MCDVDEDAVVSTPDAPSIYDIPKVLHGEGLDAYVVRRLDLPFRDVDWTEWDDLLAPRAPPRPADHDRPGRQVHRPARRLPVAGRGAAGRRLRATTPRSRSAGCQRRLRDRLTARRPLDGVDGILIPGGFGVRGIEGKIGAVRYAREHKIPILGLCLGLQCMVIEAARHLAGIADANSAEFDPQTPDPVDRHDGRSGRHRRRERATWAARCGSGLYPAALAPGSIVAEAYGSASVVEERHRHRYEVNNAYRDRLEDGRPGRLRPVAGRAAGRVHRAAARTSPVLRRHPGPPGAPVPPDPAAPAVRGLIAAALARSRATETGARAVAS